MPDDRTQRVNPLLPLFLEETQELIDRASGELMALEHGGTGRPLDSVFRSFHTLKGGAALFGFAPMTSVLHAAEDVLGEARDGRATVSRGLVDALLRCLDDIQSWLPEVAATEVLPGTAAAQAERTAAVLRQFSQARPPPPPAQAAPGGAGQAASWTATLTLAERRAVGELAPAAGEALLAIAYDPDPRCFYRGVDPIALFRRIPRLAVLRVDMQGAPASVAEITDPFVCWLKLRGIAAGAREELEAMFRLAGGQVHIEPLAVERDRDPQFLALLEEQLALLEAGEASTLAAAARVAANACRATGRAAAADRIAAASGSEALRAAIDAARPGPRTAEPAAAATGTSSAPMRMLRVAAERVERMIDLAGAAVVTRNALQHLARQMEQQSSEQQAGGQALLQPFRKQLAALDRLVRDWHEASLQLRMVPVADVFRRFPRLVRDLSHQLGREVQLITLGETLEADRDVLEALFEPLTHLVRNSVDHGIEDAASRRAAGKPPAGRLTLRASRAAGMLVIDVEDDGRGLDTAALRRRAVARGLLDSDTAEAMSEPAAADLIFLPGLSTASGISTVSGRGVGMDAVRSAAAAAGGRVAVTSRPGEGMRVSLLLPMQVSITRIMTVVAGGARLGVPLDSVRRMLRVPRRRVRALPATEASSGRPRRDGRSFALGARIVPLVSVAGALGLKPAAAGTDLPVLIVEGEHGTVALEVDRFGERADVILRPMAGLLAGTPGYLGTTLLGDGSVLLVLDVHALLA